MIITNKYSEEIITFLLGKLNALQDKLFNYYYYQIYEDFDFLNYFYIIICQQYTHIYLKLET